MFWLHEFFFPILFGLQDLFIVLTSIGIVFGVHPVHVFNSECMKCILNYCGGSISLQCNFCM